MRFGLFSQCSCFLQISCQWVNWLYANLPLDVSEQGCVLACEALAPCLECIPALSPVPSNFSEGSYYVHLLVFFTLLLLNFESIVLLPPLFRKRIWICIPGCISIQRIPWKPIETHYQLILGRFKTVLDIKKSPLFILHILQLSVYFLIFPFSLLLLLLVLSLLMLLWLVFRLFFSSIFLRQPLKENAILSYLCRHHAIYSNFQWDCSSLAQSTKTLHGPKCIVGAVVLSLYVWVYISWYKQLRIEQLCFSSLLLEEFELLLLPSLTWCCFRCQGPRQRRTLFLLYRDCL